MTFIVIFFSKTFLSTDVTDLHKGFKEETGEAIVNAGLVRLFMELRFIANGL